jgi:CheY-like chemotaxis protein
MKLDRLSMLLVGGNPSDAATLQAMIAAVSAGAYQIECAAHLDAALIRLHEASFDAILLDMGDTRLHEQLAKLHMHAPATPVVTLTSREDDSPDQHTPQAGAHAYLDRRRMAGHTLLRAIHTAIERGRNISPPLYPVVYHTLVEHLPSGVSQIDRSGQLRIANPATMRILGLPDGADPPGRSFLYVFNQPILQPAGPTTNNRIPLKRAAPTC